MAVSLSVTINFTVADRPGRTGTGDTVSTPLSRSTSASTGCGSRAGPAGVHVAFGPVPGRVRPPSAPPPPEPPHLPVPRRRATSSAVLREEHQMLEESTIQRVLGAAAGRGADFAEIFAEEKRSSSALLDDGRIEELTSGRDRGAGHPCRRRRLHRVRAHLRPERGRTDRCGRDRRGRRPRRRFGHDDRRSRPCRRPLDRTRCTIQPGDVGKARKVELLLAANETARAEGSSITQVSARYADSRRRILVANTDGTLAEDDQVKTLFSLSRGRLRRHRHADRSRVRRPHRRLRAVRHLRRRGHRPHRGTAGHHQAARPTGSLG